MANEQNLMPIEEVNSRRTREKHSKDSIKAGKKSGEVRRKRKAMKEQMEMLLSLPCNIEDENGKDIAQTLSKISGIDKDSIDNQMFMIISLWKTATNIRSNQQIQAVKEIRDIVKDEQIVNESNRVQIINDLPKDDDNGAN